MNGNNGMVSSDVLSGDDVFMADETEVTEIEVTEETEETEQTDTEAGADVSVTDSLTVTDTSVAECLFTDVNICNKLDIIIMLLIVMIAIKMFSPLANNHKRGLNEKGRYER